LRKQKKKIKLTKCNYDAQIYCFRNNYRIYPVPVKDGFNIHIDQAHKHYEITQLHKAEDIDQAIWDTYELIYNKKNAKT
jgi:hypothetical protein